MAEAVANLPRCRLCGVVDHFLGEHLTEVHSLTLDDYLSLFPGAPTISEDLVKELGEPTVRRVHPPADTDLVIQIRDFKVRVNPDVPTDACLPMPAEYRFPV